MTGWRQAAPKTVYGRKTCLRAPHPLILLLETRPEMCRRKVPTRKRLHFSFLSLLSSVFLFTLSDSLVSGHLKKNPQSPASTFNFYYQTTSRPGLVFPILLNHIHCQPLPIPIQPPNHALIRFIFVWITLFYATKICWKDFIDSDVSENCFSCSYFTTLNFLKDYNKTVTLLNYFLLF